jgi:hypothetical protein
MNATVDGASEGVPAGGDRAGAHSGRYFKEIAHRFLVRRGAPLFLSAKDIDLIAQWEKAGIPLAIVLEGIDRAFLNRRSRGAAGDKVLALSFCAIDVLRGVERVRDRRVGGTRALPSRPDPRAAVRTAIEAFLKSAPSVPAGLAGLYREALEKLDGGGLPDDEAEALDARADAIILAAADPAGREALRAEVRTEYRTLPEAEAARAADVRLVKIRREEHKIPYLAPYYYG